MLARDHCYQVADAEMALSFAVVAGAATTTTAMPMLAPESGSVPWTSCGTGTHTMQGGGA